MTREAEVEITLACDSNQKLSPRRLTFSHGGEKKISPPVLMPQTLRDETFDENQTVRGAMLFFEFVSRCKKSCRVRTLNGTAVPLATFDLWKHTAGG